MSKIPPFEDSSQPDRVNHLPGLGCIKDLELAGHLPVHADSNRKESLFYWFVGSQRKVDKDPIVLWFNGGPGASSFYGFFAENGPYVVNNSGNLSPRKFAWTAQTSYLIIEQTTGVGLSYKKPGSHLASESEAIDQIYAAVEAFFIRYPELAKNPLYLAGQSYAGKYIPQLAKRILTGNSHRAGKKNSGAKINLQGILIGDGWVNPLLQQSANADFAYSHGLIDLQTYQKVNSLYHECAREIRSQTPSSKKANQVCMKMQKLIRKVSGVESTDIRTQTEPDYSPIVKYLNRPDVRRSLHVDSKVGIFRLFSEETSQDLEIGIQDSAADLYPSLISENVKVLIYNGLDDGTDSNFMGTNLWLNALNWAGKNSFAKAPTCIWRNSQEIAGYVRSSAGLTQVKIRGAGHLAPMDQPANTQDMLHRFVFKQDFCNH